MAAFTAADIVRFTPHRCLWVAQEAPAERVTVVNGKRCLSPTFWPPEVRQLEDDVVWKRIGALWNDPFAAVVLGIALMLPLAISRKPTPTRYFLPAALHPPAKTLALSVMLSMAVLAAGAVAFGASIRSVLWHAPPAVAAMCIVALAGLTMGYAAVLGLKRKSLSALGIMVTWLLLTAVPTERLLSRSTLLLPLSLPVLVGLVFASAVLMRYCSQR